MESELAERAGVSGGRLGGALAVLALVAVSAILVPGPVPGEASPEPQTDLVPSADRGQILLKPSSWASGDYADGAFDSFEDDDLGGHELSSADVQASDSPTTRILRVARTAKGAPRGSHLARGPPSA